MVVVTGTGPSIPGGRRLSFLGGVKFESAKTPLPAKRKALWSTFLAHSSGFEPERCLIIISCGSADIEKGKGGLQVVCTSRYHMFQKGDEEQIALLRYACCQSLVLQD